MRNVRVFLVFVAVLMVAGVANGSTRVGIVAAGRVLEAGGYDAESGVLNVTVEFYDVVQKSICHASG